MNKEVWSILGAVMAVVVLAILITMTGCAEKEPVECAGCGDLEALLHDSFSTNSALLDQRSENSDIIDEAVATIKSLEDELLKANAEIVACWKIIEAVEKLGRAG